MNDPDNKQVDQPVNQSPKKHYSVMLFVDGKKVTIPLVDTSQRIERKSKSGKYGNMVFRVLKGSMPNNEE